MADEHVPVTWISEAVYVSRGTNPMYGKLEDVSEHGIVLRSSKEVSWGGRMKSGRQRNNETRTVSEFYPWHVVAKIRVLEPEEREERGLE